VSGCLSNHMLALICKPLENLHEGKTFAVDIAVQILCSCCALKLLSMEASLKQNSQFPVHSGRMYFQRMHVMQQF
jgi:hypothetical protein